MLTKSESIAKLVEALVAAQKEFPKLVKGHQNPFYQSWYADLSDIIEATGPALRAHGLAVVQLPGSNGNGMPGVTTMLTHISGEWIAGELSLPAGKPDAQSYGSAITYARRYGYQAILGVAAEDDDGNAAQPDKKKRQAAPVAPAPKEPQPSPNQAQAGDFLDIHISEVRHDLTKPSEKNPNGVPYVWVVDGRKSWPCFDAGLFDRLMGLQGERTRVKTKPGKKGPVIVDILNDAPQPADPQQITDADCPF